MKRVIYIFQSGKLSRKDNTLMLENESGNRSIPVNAVSDINVFGEVSLNTKLLTFLSKNNIVLHFFNHYGFYVGSFYPREYYNSGLMTVLQVQHFLDEENRLFLAKSFVLGSVLNMAKNLKDVCNDFLDDIGILESAKTIPEIMAYEGKKRERYYSFFGDLINLEEFVFEKRTKRPPKNPLNALISFGNSLLYTTVLSEIYRTHLDPRIGYLHETNQRSFTLNLDIAEVFKPIIVDRVIFRLLNRKRITLKHFDQKTDASFLTENGMKIFVEEYEKKLSETIRYKNIGKVSYRRLIRLECYKLYKHFLGEKVYKPFTIKE
ncbi:MAG: type I-B CRISPR-associated endonuclease Cas1b [candidate division WOR-3 bacterium]